MGSPHNMANDDKLLVLNELSTVLRLEDLLPGPYTYTGLIRRSAAWLEGPTGLIQAQVPSFYLQYWTKGATFEKMMNGCVVHTGAFAWLNNYEYATMVEHLPQGEYSIWSVTQHDKTVVRAMNATETIFIRFPDHYRGLLRGNVDLVRTPHGFLFKEANSPLPITESYDLEECLRTIENMLELNNNNASRND